MTNPISSGRHSRFPAVDRSGRQERRRVEPRPPAEIDVPNTAAQDQAEAEAILAQLPDLELRQRIASITSPLGTDVEVLDATQAGEANLSAEDEADAKARMVDYFAAITAAATAAYTEPAHHTPAPADATVVPESPTLAQGDRDLTAPKAPERARVEIPGEAEVLAPTEFDGVIEDDSSSKMEVSGERSTSDEVTDDQLSKMGVAKLTRWADTPEKAARALAIEKANANRSTAVATLSKRVPR